MNEPHFSSFPVSSFWVLEKRLTVSFAPSPVLVATESSSSWIWGAWSPSCLKWTGWREDTGMVGFR